MWRWRCVALICLWLIDVSMVAGVRWVDDASLSNGFWSWPAFQVYHVALWLLVALLVLIPKET